MYILSKKKKRIKCVAYANFTPSKRVKSFPSIEMNNIRKNVILDAFQASSREILKYKFLIKKTEITDFK